MHFNSNNSRIYNNLIGQSKLIWYSITLFIAVLFIFTWFKFIQKPLNKILINHEKILSELKNNLDNNIDRENNNYKNFNIKSLRENFSRLRQNFAPIDKDNGEIFKIIDAAASSGLIIKLYDNKPELEKNWYSKYNYEFEIEGSFDAISNLLEKINNRNSSLRFLNFIAKSNSDGLINLKMTIQLLGLKNEKN